ncbi:MULTISPECIES: hypothetical protein [Bacillus]|uniref:Uncharacterized protein n=2 Tax=Bacillus cereus group TaxID=86661 RepID=A0A9X6ZE63_BACCE|nr:MULTISPECIES: hypothetical protein [Bacillus cereus group]PEZ75182.1 hypothetical protein CN410_13935 [Bacillus anthracis]KXY51023.1 hypothetical protein AT268_31415 [Bacillus cereus]MED0951013.1 hypothetical protein [Bacillus mobilis]PES55571.1 hypothetical protein CN515_06030 [Bacillus cereus]PFA29374.1 hypothetical protein CN384_06595 [Bacillus thuringiensis]
MNKYNVFGMELISYKTEILKDYPDIVKRSLHDTFDKLLEHNAIDEDIHFSLKDDGMDTDRFKSFILTKIKCIKSNEELLVEYEVIRERLESHIQELIQSQELETESFVEKENISIIKKFVIDTEFAQEYFGIEEKDLEKSMKPKGFVEKFAVLRLPKILKDFVQIDGVQSEYFNYEAINSFLVYREEETTNYCIDLCLSIPIDIAEDETKTVAIMEDVSNVVSKAEEYFGERLTI